MPTPSPSRSPLRATGRARWGDPLFRWAAIGAGISVLAVLGLMIVSTTADAWPVFRYQGVVDFFTSDEWRAGFSRDELTGRYGAFAFVYGTLLTSLIAIGLAVPLALAISLYLTRLAPRRLRGALTAAVEMLAAVPSVVYGLWGLLFFVPTFLRPVMELLEHTLGGVPLVGALFAGPVYATNYLAAGTVLAIMILPIITAISREVIARVPPDQVQAAYGLGATDWEVMRRIILRHAFPGVVGATMLGLGRALGETIAVAMLIGGSQRWGLSLFFGGDAMAAHIANTFQDAAPETVTALIAVGVGLFVITVVVNALARLLVWRLGPLTGDAGL